MMYDSHVFLSALFYKLHVYDKEVRQQIMDIYCELVENILSVTSDVERIEIFKNLLPLFQQTTDYFNRIKSTDGQVDKYSVDLFKALVENYLILFKEYHGARRRQEVFTEIMKQVNVDDLVCDIGEYVLEFKTTTSIRQKISIVCQLKVMLTDYNSITKSFLTLHELLKRNNANGEL